MEELVMSMPHAAEMADKMGIRLIEATPDRLVAAMPVEGNRQATGLLFGGASVYLAEALGSIGSSIHGFPDRVAVGVDINATHHRSVESGVVTATAAPIHVGRSMESWEIVIADDEGRRVCTARITNAMVPTQKSAG